MEVLFVHGLFEFVNLTFEFVNAIVFCFDDVKELRDAFVRGLVSVFISSNASHKKSRDRLISANSDSSVALAVRFPAFGMVGVIVFARLCGLPVAHCQCMLLRNRFEGKVGLKHRGSEILRWEVVTQII